MVKRLLFLLILITALVICERESVVVQADACDNCNNTYSNCIASAGQSFNTCLDSSYQFWVDCVNSGYPEWLCDETADDLDNVCWSGWANNTSNCDSAHFSCLLSDCGGSGGHGPGQGGTYCGDGYTGYSEYCYPIHIEQRDLCLSEGSEGSVYQQCIGNGASQAQCCNEQAQHDIEINCQCLLDPRNPACKACYSL